ncbi:MAG TPA: TetR family transcriptional regulator [Actinomycetales bacterium]|nr:TetR family transcriptional regulator [Actinomycetales bacterium]
MAQPASEVKETARRRRTRERLMDAAHALFAAHGVNAVSIEAIAEEAGFTRGAFYSNFASKNELFFAMLRREGQIRLESLRAAVAHHIPTQSGGELSADFISQVITEVFAALPDDRNWELIHSEFELLALRDAEAAPEFLATEELFRTELAEVLVSTAQAMGLRFVIDPLLATDLVMTQYKWAVREAILRRSDDTPIATHDIMLKTMPALLGQLLAPID